jgi:hypothetical protein
MKVKVGTTLLIAIVLISTLALTGCDTVRTLLEPALDSDEDMPALSESEAWAQAVEAVTSFKQGEVALFQTAQASNDFSTYGEDVMALLLEETGLTWPFIDALFFTHMEENEEERGLSPDARVTPFGLVAEYLKLSYQYPKKTQAELVELFRASARNGNTTVIAEAVEASLGIDSITEPGAPGLSAAQARTLAIETVKMLQTGQTALFQKAQETNDDTTLMADLDNLYMESGILALHVKAGFDAEQFGVPLWYLFSQQLLAIHFEENPEEVELFIELLEELLLALLAELPELLAELPNLEEGEPPEGLPVLNPEGLPEELQTRLPTMWGLFVEYLQLSYQYPGKTVQEILVLFQESARNGNTTVSQEKVEASFGITFQPGDVLFWTYQPPVDPFEMGEPQP